MALSAEKQAETYNKGSKPLPAFPDGVDVACQNPHTRKWDRGGTVIERLPHRQYRVKLGGSGRVMLRNRRHLRSVYRGVPEISPSVDTPPVRDISSPTATPSSTLASSPLLPLSDIDAPPDDVGGINSGSSEETVVVRSSSRLRPQRKVHDPSTGKLVEPSGVPEDIYLTLDLCSC